MLTEWIALLAAGAFGSGLTILFVVPSFMRVIGAAERTNEQIRYLESRINYEQGRRSDLARMIGELDRTLRTILAGPPDDLRVIRELAMIDRVRTRYQDLKARRANNEPSSNRPNDRPA